MLIDQVFYYFLIGVGVIISMPALWLLMRARWPQRVEKLRTISDRSILLSFFLGLIPLAIVIGVFAKAIQFSQRMDVAGAIALAIFGAVLLVCALAGLTGLAGLIGEKLASGHIEPWRATLRGGLIIVCLLSMPFVGWFALLPVCIITGGGMMLRSLFVKSAQPVVAQVPQAAPPLPVQQSIPTA